MSQIKKNKKNMVQVSSEKVCPAVKLGFTLVELMVVIAIIGILSGVVLVSSGGGVDKSKKASAIATMSSMLPELVTCQDDNGKAIATTAPTAGTTYLCCTAANCADNINVGGHTGKWADIATKSGYVYGIPTGTLNNGDYIFTATKLTSTITCKYETNECTEATT